ncbi:HvfB family MNIO-type RiPP peptide maturase [Shewanella surugensis]|uniref:UPF0276 protein L2764_13040 n=1 Tax=Shewanella surugensis TaxID=212020 RepID=A0ABT0LCG1_9GAMM|nr:DUF692 domain-containing protein [Shewanella surugensis]MCL1125377.1 DUF692 domain-containing protein [Shewanella surugensis]
MLTDAKVGLGLRREMLDEFNHFVPDDIHFFEVAPENWMKLGGQFQKPFRALTERYEFYTHGLSLSIGGPEKLDVAFVKEVKQFLDLHQIKIYSEHLSYCSGLGHLYDLMPIPFTQEAVFHVVERVKQVQDIIERPLILENVSFYAAPSAEMTELDFIKAVLAEADCQLLLDINNIYVNSVNHGYDAREFLKAIPHRYIAYLHIAGHYQQEEDLIIDTHGANITDPVWTLLKECYDIHGVFPTLLERDFNIPKTEELLIEIKKIKQYQNAGIDFHHLSRSA